MAMRDAVGRAETELSRKKLFERRTGLIRIRLIAVALGNHCVPAIVIDFDADRYDRWFDLCDEVAEARGSLSRFGRVCGCRPCRKIWRQVTARPDDENGHTESGN